MSASRIKSPERHKTAIDRIVGTAMYLQTESRKLAKEQASSHGITATQLNVLKLLLAVGDLSLSQLSKRMMATNSTVTGIVDRMVAANLVSREQSATDRRVWRIKLTPEGKTVARKVNVAPWDILQRAVLSLPPAELEQLIKTLTKVVDSVETQIGKPEEREQQEAV